MWLCGQAGLFVNKATGHSSSGIDEKNAMLLMVLGFRKNAVRCYVFDCLYAVYAGFR